MINTTNVNVDAVVPCLRFEFSHDAMREGVGAGFAGFGHHEANVWGDSETGAKLVDMGDGTYNVRTEREERHRFGLWHHLEGCCGAVVVDRITSILHFQIVFVSLRYDKA